MLLQYPKMFASTPAPPGGMTRVNAKAILLRVKITFAYFVSISH